MLCCPVGYVESLTYRDRLNSSENYLQLGFLLVMPLQPVLLLVRQSLIQDNFQSQFSTPVPVKLNDGQIYYP